MQAYVSGRTSGYMPALLKTPLRGYTAMRQLENVIVLNTLTASADLCKTKPRLGPNLLRRLRAFLTGLSERLKMQGFEVLKCSIFSTTKIK